MRYAITDHLPCAFVIDNPPWLERARRRLDAAEIRFREQEEDERTLGWFGMLLCLAGGFMELDCLKWIFA